MSTILTGVGTTFDNTVTSPADGDVANGALYQGADQRHANNTKYLYDKITTGGVVAIRNVANLAALKALTGMLTGQAAYVKGYGTYLYVDPDATADSSPWAIEPTSGSGCWFHSLYSQQDAASGVAVLDASRKVATARLPNALVDTHFSEPSSVFTLTSATFVDVTSMSGFEFLDPELGDILEIEASFVAVMKATTTTTHQISSRISAGTGAGEVVSRTSTARVNLFNGEESYIPITQFFRYECTSYDVSDSAVPWKVQVYRTTAGTGTYEIYPIAVHAKLYRP